MEEKEFRVDQIDHLHVFVPDQYEAAAWYKEILGFEILPEYEDWATEGGPLTISWRPGTFPKGIRRRLK